MPNQTPLAVKNLTSQSSPSISPKAKQRGLGGVISNFENLFLICFSVSVVVLLFSFIGFLSPLFREICFFIILFAVLVLSLYRLEYGLYAALIELILGSKGYLFYFDFNGFNISLRIGIFLVVVGVYFAKLILRNSFVILGRAKAKPKNPSKFFWDRKLSWYVPFFIVIVIGFSQGLFRNFGFQNVFFDANGYFYLLYLFPFLSTFKNKNNLQKIYDILLSSGLVLVFFSLFLFYIFSHELFNIDLVYEWLRNNLLFEITFTGSVFRIFAQSQIFLLVIFFLALQYLTQRKNFYLAIIAAFFSTTGILVSLSRSFFVGLLAGLLIFFILLYLKQKKECLKIFLAVVLIFASSVTFLWTIEKNMPLTLIGRVASLRPSAIETEPASLTRQEELKPLLLEIIKKPFLGWGFGKTVTFETRDPRALTMLPQCAGKTSCLFTTYAFEWGYLDLWLKLGLFGLVCFLGVLYSTFKIGYAKFRIGENSSLWVLASLVAVATTNIFSPYLNHPLGLGILILLTVHNLLKRDILAATYSIFLPKTY